MHITPDMAERAYELLRATLPFRRWNLPHADEVEFRILPMTDCFANVQVGTDKTIMRLSCKLVRTVDLLIRATAHEMTHMHEVLHHDVPNRPVHSGVFKRLAAQVCRHHGFDLKAF